MAPFIAAQLSVLLEANIIVFKTISFGMVKMLAISRSSEFRNDMNKKTFYKERKINNRCFDFLSKQNKIVPLIMDMDG